jgi:hypothetical protein
VADRSTPLIIAALSRAVTDPRGVPLHGTRGSPGLFPGSAAARHAARIAKEQDLLRVVGNGKRGKNQVEICAITDNGLAYLLRRVNPKQVLEDLVTALEGRQQQVSALVVAAQQTRADLERLRNTTEKVLQSVGVGEPVAPSTAVAHCNGSSKVPTAAADWVEAIVRFLTDWQAAHPTEDCPLPHLYRYARPVAGALSIGQFHDGIRRLYDDGRIYLHPWTGPLHDIPEPSLTLMVGHEIAYYSSLRNQKPETRNQKAESVRRAILVSGL